MKKETKTLIALHLLLLVFSMGSIASKKAASYEFLSWGFIIFYGIVLAILAFYAIAWQQVLKNLSLVTAYANKAVTIIWGIIWGYLFFDEKITIAKVVGAIVIIVGVYFVVSDKADSEEKEAQ